MIHITDLNLLSLFKRKKICLDSFTILLIGLLCRLHRNGIGGKKFVKSDSLKHSLN